MLDRRAHNARPPKGGGARRRPPKSRLLFVAAAVMTVIPIQGAVRAAGADVTDAGANAVLKWNATAGNALLAACDFGGYAPQEARIQAMTQIAVHDALQAIEPRSTPYAARLPAAPAASAEAAVAAAAHGVLVPVLRQMSFFLPVADCIDKGVAVVEADYADALTAIDDGAAKSSGLALGQAAANAVLALRAADGYDTPLVDPTTSKAPPPGSIATHPAHRSPSPHTWAQTWLRSSCAGPASSDPVRRTS